MGVPLALIRTPNVINAYILHCCWEIAFGARDGRFALAGKHVGAREIKRTPKFNMRTHGSYDQPAICSFVVLRKFN